MALAGFGAVPVVSRRPMSDVTGPKTLTCPIAHNESMSAHGVVHCPRKILPNPPWKPAAEFRDATVTAWVASRSSGAFCSTWNQAVRPAPMLSLPRTPKLDDGACTSNLDTDGTATAPAFGSQAPPAAAVTSRAVKPSPYFTCPNVGYSVPYTSTLACASARPGAANAPATAMVRSFFCMLTPLWFKPGERRLAPRQPLSREVQRSVPNSA